MPRVASGLKSRGPVRTTRRTSILLGLLMSLLVTLAPSPASAADIVDSRTLPSVEDLPPVQPAAPMDPATTPDLGPPPAAQKWEQGKEIVARRTANTKTFAGDLPGSYETKFFAEPVHFDDGGKWVDIETGLRPETVPRSRTRRTSSDSTWPRRPTATRSPESRWTPTTRSR